MLEDRDYMHDQTDKRFGSIPPVSAWFVILVLNVVVFLAQNAGGADFNRAFFRFGALSLEGLKHGFLWQLLTFQFMHGSLGHLLLNSVALYFFARQLEAHLGKRIFLNLYLLSGLAGGLVQVILAMCADRFGGGVVGASAGLCGLVAAFALLNPQSTIYVFLVLPLRALYFLPLMIALTVLFIVLPTGDHVAHGAHLGGILAGVAWIKLGWHRDFVTLPWDGLFSRWHRWRPLEGRQRKRELVRAAKVRAESWKRATPDSPTDLPPEEFISKEVDPILDKISAHGIQSLTEKERKILEAARHKMAKR